MAIHKPDNSAGWICQILGFLVSMGAAMWLLVSFATFPTPTFLVPGFIQLGIGIFLIAAKWVIPNSKHPITIFAAIVCLSINVIFAVGLTGLKLSTSEHFSRGTNKLTASDPDSPTIVTVEDSRGLLQNNPAWSGTIYADGKRPTQYTGWPVDWSARKQTQPN